MAKAFLLLGDSATFTSTVAGTRMGLKERLWGQMGVTMMAATPGCTMLAPADAA